MKLGVAWTVDRDGSIHCIYTPQMRTPRGTLDVVWIGTTNGFLYAIATAPANDVRAGEIVIRVPVARPRPVQMDGGVPMGILSTPVLDVDASPPRIYVTAHDSERGWLAFAIDAKRGNVLPGWPVALDDASLGAVNRNGSARFHASDEMSQRGALAISPEGDRLYVTFGTYGFQGVGWIATIDTRGPIRVTT